MEYLGNGEWSNAEEPQDDGSVVLADLIAEGRLVSVTDHAIIATQKTGGVYHAVQGADGTVQLSDDVDMRELGTSLGSPWFNWLREDINPLFRTERGLQKIMEMKRGDGTIRGTLRLFKTPIVGARWYVNPGAEEPSDRDRKVAKRFGKMLFEDMSTGWAQTLNEILLMADYGHMVFEKVFFEYDDGFLGWSKLAPRHPMDIQEWVWDKNGGPAGVRMKVENDPDGKFIPIDKLLIFTMDVECGDLRGTSILRSAYKHWYYKESLYKIDAIQKERHGIGIPVIMLPPGFSDADKALAEELGRNLRTNERAHVVLPSNWKIEFAKLEGQPVNVIESINHHNDEIVKNILAPFLNSHTTSQSMSDTENSLFMKSTRYVAHTVADVINMHGFRQLMGMNYLRPPATPMLMGRRIGEWDDLRTLSFALRNLIGAGAIRPDDPLEAQLRRELDLPPVDLDSVREVATPQGDPNGDPEEVDGAPGAPTPPRVGPPRQTPAGNMGTGQRGTGSNGRTGRDNSGGN